MTGPKFRVKTTRGRCNVGNTGALGILSNPSMGKANSSRNGRAMFIYAALRTLPNPLTTRINKLLGLVAHRLLQGAYGAQNLEPLRSWKLHLLTRAARVARKPIRIGGSVPSQARVAPTT
jgi:hypothetical protein